jgi:hypothetical protein
LKTSSTNEEKIAVLAEMICRTGDEAGTKSAALLVLMSTLENATHPKVLQIWRSTLLLLAAVS